MLPHRGGKIKWRLGNDNLFSPKRISNWTSCTGIYSILRALAEPTASFDARVDIEKGANTATGNTDLIFIPPNKHLIPDQFMDDRVGYASFWPGADNRIR
jgi:hypothetical protein